MNRGRPQEWSGAILANYPHGGLHSLPTFTRPYFASLPRSGSELSIVSTKSAAAERLVENVPLVARNPPPMKPLRHVYSTMRDSRFGKTRDMSSDLAPNSSFSDPRTLSGSKRTMRLPSLRTSPVHKNPTAPRIPSPLAYPVTAHKDEEDSSFENESLLMSPIDESRLQDNLPPDWKAHLNTAEEESQGDEISSIPMTPLDMDEDEAIIEIENDSSEVSYISSTPHKSLFTTTPDSSPEARPFSLSRHWHIPNVNTNAQREPQSNEAKKKLESGSSSGSLTGTQHKLERFIIYRVLFWIAIWWISSAFMFTVLEDHWTLLDGFYFTFTTMATVGYGDLSLRSPWSWEVWYFFIFQGVCHSFRLWYCPTWRLADNSSQVAILTFCIEGCGHDLGYRVNRRLMKFYLERLERKEEIDMEDSDYLIE
jgi:hypothetical protein